MSHENSESLVSSVASQVHNLYFVSKAKDLRLGIKLRLGFKTSFRLELTTTVTAKMVGSFPN